MICKLSPNVSEDRLSHALVGLVQLLESGFILIWGQLDDLAVFVSHGLARVFTSRAHLVLEEECFELLFVDLDHVLSILITIIDVILIVFHVLHFLTSFILVVILVLHASHAHVLLLLSQLLITGVILINFFLIVNFIILFIHILLLLVHVVHLVLSFFIIHVLFVLLLVFSFDLDFIPLINDLLIIVVILVLSLSLRLLVLIFFFVFSIIIILIFLMDHILLWMSRYLQPPILLHVLLLLLLLVIIFLLLLNIINHLLIRLHHTLVLWDLETFLIREVRSRRVETIIVVSRNEQFTLLISQVLIWVHTSNSQHIDVLLKLFDLL